MRLLSLESRLPILFGLSLGLGCADDGAQADGGVESGTAGESGTAAEGSTTSTDETSASGTSGDSGDSSDSGDSTTGDPPDPAEPMFEFGTIAEFDIALSPESIASLWIDPKVYVLGDVTVTVNGEVTELFDVGVRIKGNYGSLRNLSQKAAFLLNFDRFVDKQKLFGLEKLAVNNMVQDPSMQRESLGYQLFRESGVPAARSAHAVVTVNGEPYGLYATVEAMDNEEFLERWFVDESGNLYEGAYGSDLYYDWLATYDLDNGMDVGFADLAELVSALDGMNDPNTFVDDVSEFVDLDSYLTTVAADLYLGDWDGYAWTRNNYFMYRRPSDMRWVFMPWGIDQLMVDYLDPFGGGGRLTMMCAASLECRALLADKFEAVVALVDQLALAGQAQTLADTLYEAALADPRKEYDINTVQYVVGMNIDFLTNRGPQVLDALLCANPESIDDDNDGFNGCGEDCDDNDPDVYPGAVEVCDLDDDDCDGQWDNDPMCPQCVIQPLPDPEVGNAAFCFGTKNFAEAEADCVTQGGHLMSVHTQEMQNFLTANAFAIWNGDWWIGINDLAQEGNFVWSDGTPVDYTAWNGGEPNDWGGGEDCGNLPPWSGGLWNDLGCGAVIPYICRLP